MTVDRDVTTEGARRHAAPAPAEVRNPTETPVRTGSRAGKPVSTATVVAYALAGAAILGWFLFGWLVLRQGFVDSVGESAGAAFALLLVVSIVGTVRRSRRR